MTFRYLTRPERIRKTPRSLARLLGVKRIIKQSELDGYTFDFNRDFLLIPPNPNNVSNAPRDYNELYKLFVKNKRDQRKQLEQLGFVTPNTAKDVVKDLFIVRPLTHMSGNGYVIQGHDGHNNKTNYVQPVFNKAWEYRIITCYGVPIITLLKTNPNKLPPQEAWNFVNGCVFQSVNNIENNRVRHTTFYDTLYQVPWLKYAPLLAWDIMVSKKMNYALCEVNFAPGITIEANLEKIKEQALNWRLEHGNAR